MKLLFDQNLSHWLVTSLFNDFAGSAHVRDVGLAFASDSDLWKYAAASGFAIVSKDYDFQQRALLFGHTPKVNWIRLGNCRTEDISALLFSLKSEIDTFEADPWASFLDTHEKDCLTIQVLDHASLRAVYLVSWPVVQSMLQLGDVISFPNGTV